MLLSSLCAEGTPVLALDIAKLWRRAGVKLQVWTLQSSPSDLAAEFQEAGIEVRSMAITQRGYSKFPALAWRAFEICRRHRLDAVLSFPFGWHSYIAWGAGLAGTGTVVAHAGNYPPVGDSVGVRKLRVTVAIGDVWRPHIACCSDHVREGLAQYLGIPASRLHTIYNGVDLARFAGTAAPGRPLREPLRIGMVARFEPHKDQPTLLRAIRELKSRDVNICVDLIGDGSRRAEYQALAEQLDIAGCIHFLGVRRDIPDLLRGWDLFVFSVSPDEGLGVALIEALAAGVPVVASDVGACREVLNCPVYGILGELFPAGDSVELANAILRFRDHPEPWWDRAARATASVHTRFSIEAMSDSYLRLLGVV
jgi:glycosyltransferase involved in cell wall biosynthesis